MAVAVEAMSTKTWRTTQQRRPGTAWGVGREAQDGHVTATVRPNRDPSTVDDPRLKWRRVGLDEVDPHLVIGRLPCASVTAHAWLTTCAQVSTWC